MPQPIAILVSDIHLSHKPPIFRSEEPDWYAAMKRPLDELLQVAEDNRVPIICAGDIFDKWNSPAELINFAIDNLPYMYAIPGQHDLPHHRLEDIQKSAYWSLVLAETIKHLNNPNGTDLETNSWRFCVYPFPWGIDIVPVEIEPYQGCQKIAAIHSYVWCDEKNSYPGAPKEKLLGHYNLRGYDAAVFGDNHKGFISRSQKSIGCPVMNCGTFMVRKSDERNYKPQIGILHEDASIKPHYLDTSKDVYFDDTEIVSKVEQAETYFDNFIDDLKSLGLDSLDFREAVNRRLDLDNVSEPVRRAVMEAIDE